MGTHIKSSNLPLWQITMEPFIVKEAVGGTGHLRPIGSYNRFFSKSGTPRCGIAEKSFLSTCERRCAQTQWCCSTVRGREQFWQAVCATLLFHAVPGDLR